MGRKEFIGLKCPGGRPSLRQVKAGTQELRTGIWRQGSVLYNVVLPKPRNSFCQGVQESHCGCCFLTYLLDHPLLVFSTTQKSGLGPPVSVVNKNNSPTLTHRPMWSRQSFNRITTLGDAMQSLKPKVTRTTLNLRSTEHTAVMRGGVGALNVKALGKLKWSYSRKKMLLFFNICISFYTIFFYIL